MRGTASAERSPVYRSRFETFYRLWQPFCLTAALRFCENEDEAYGVRALAR